jgi:tRNA-2-methylthio-N6-dimethylallyladenosine synthase
MMGRIRETIPDCAVSSDFIVGFCGESVESFQKTMRAVEDYRFKNSFIFKYSPRPGTKAFDLYADDVPEETKKRRNNELLALQNAISEEDNAEFIGRTVEILVEGPSKKASRATGSEGAGQPPQSLPGWHDGAAVGESSTGDADGDLVQLNNVPVSSVSPTLQLVGRTRCDRLVVFEGNPRLAGTLAQVRVEDCTATTLIGAIVTRHVQPGSGELLPILA